MNLVHLHNHSIYSVGDGASKCGEMAGIAKEFGMPAVAITDHGTVAGWYKFRGACKEAGVKPIYGLEAYILFPQKALDKDGKEIIEDIRCHITLLAANEAGLYEIYRLQNRSAQKSECINLQDIIDIHPQNVICLTGCPSGVFYHIFYKDHKAAYDAKDLETAKNQLDLTKIDEALKYLQGLKESFKAVYVEIQYNLPIQNVMINVLREMAKRSGLKCVPTCDTHYIRKEDFIIQSAAISAFRKEEAPSYTGTYFQTADEIGKWATQEEIENTIEVSNLCNADLKTITPVIYGMPDVNVKQMCLDSLKEKSLDKSPVYVDRLNYELEIVYEFGLQDYFAIVWDICRAVDEAKLKRGPGRGSCGGSLICYLLNIIIFDPIEYGLYFERFLNRGRMNKDRIKLPDIDLDLEPAGKEFVFRYLKGKYGERNVMKISTFSEYGFKNAVQAVARVYNNGDKALPITITKRIIELYGSEPDNAEDVLKNENVMSNVPAEWVDIIKKASMLAGHYKHRGSHASGVIVMPNLEERLPTRIIKGEQTVEFEMGDAEAAGGLKFDILGLKALESIKYMEIGLKKIKDIRETKRKEKENQEKKLFDRVISELGSKCVVTRVDYANRVFYTQNKIFWMIPQTDSKTVYLPLIGNTTAMPKMVTNCLLVYPDKILDVPYRALLSGMFKSFNNQKYVVVSDSIDQVGGHRIPYNDFLKGIPETRLCKKSEENVNG